MDIYQWIGFFGMIFIVIAYLFLQTNKNINFKDYATQIRIEKAK